LKYNLSNIGENLFGSPSGYDFGTFLNRFKITPLRSHRTACRLPCMCIA